MGLYEKHYFETEKAGYRTGGEVLAWIKRQTARGVFEEPGTADIVKVTTDLNLDQVAERVEDNSRQDGTRSPMASFSDRYPMGNAAMGFNIYPPRALSGTSKPYGFALLDALVGQEGVIVASQAGVNIDAVISHSSASTVVQIVGTTAVWYKHLVAALRPASSTNTSYSARGVQRLVTAVTDLGSGNLQVTFSRGFPVKPVVGDDIRGGVVWYPNDAVRWDQRLFSGLMTSGSSAGQGVDGTVPKANISLQPNGLLNMTAEFHYLSAIRSAEDQVKGVSGAYSFATSDLTLDVPGAWKYQGQVGALVNLKRVTTSDDWVTSAVASTETKAKIASASTANGTVTFTNRGTTPVSATALRAVTSATQETNGSYTIPTGGILRIAIDRRTPIDIALTAGSRTAAQVILEINTALAASRYYGIYRDSPFLSFDWSQSGSRNVAVPAGSAVRLMSYAWGSQSRIQVIDTGLSTSCHNIVFQAAFAISPTEEIQIEPWDPGGSISVDPILVKEGRSWIDGAEADEATLELGIDNQLQAVRVRNDSSFEAGFVPGLHRAVTAKLSGPATGWHDQLRTRAQEDEPFFLQAQAGLGSDSEVGATWGIHYPRVRAGTPAKTGEAIQQIDADLYPEEDIANGLKEFYIALT